MHRRMRALSSGILFFSTWASATRVHQSHRQLRSNQTSASGVERQAWALRCCNAYALGSALHVVHVPRPWGVRPVGGEKEEPLDGGILQYKQCKDLSVNHFGVGSELRFQQGSGLQMGSFAVSNLPAEGGLLLLVVHRHNAVTTAADFTSHIFSTSSIYGGIAEIAVVDAYQGSSNSGLELRGTKNRWKLHPGSTVRVRPGKYKWLLNGVSSHGSEFNLLGGEKYVAIRVGADAKEGPSYPEELLVYPGRSSLEQWSGAGVGWRRNCNVAIGLALLAAGPATRAAHGF